MTIQQLYAWSKAHGTENSELKIMGADIKYIGYHEPTNSVVLDECIDEDMENYMENIKEIEVNTNE